MALPGKSKGNNYVEVVHKVADREWAMMEVSQQPAARSSAQQTAEAEKDEETELEEYEVGIYGRMSGNWRNGGRIGSARRN